MAVTEIGRNKYCRLVASRAAAAKIRVSISIFCFIFFFPPSRTISSRVQHISTVVLLEPPSECVNLFNFTRGGEIRKIM